MQTVYKDNVDIIYSTHSSTAHQAVLPIIFIDRQFPHLRWNQSEAKRMASR